MKLMAGNQEVEDREGAIVGVAKDYHPTTPTAPVVEPGGEMGVGAVADV